MLINKIHISNFGGLKNCELMLDDNFNIIQGPNEFGKTTLFAFIRAMLFGLKGNRRSVTRDYDRYLPLENPTDFRGSLFLELGGEEYKIERNFYRKSRLTKITNLDTGKTLSESEWQSLLSPIDYETFTNTCYISSETTRPGESFMDILQERIIGLAQSNSGDIFVHSSIDKLNDKEKVLKAKQRSLPKVDEAELYDKKIDLETKIEEVETNLGLDVQSSPSKSLNVCIIIIAFVSILAAISSTALLSTTLKLPVAATFYCIALLSLLYLLYLMQKNKSYASTKEQKDIMYGRLEELYHQLSINEDCFMELKNIQNEAKKLTLEIDTIRFAKSSIQNIAREIYSSNTNELNTRLSEIFSKITDESYSGVFINEDMNIYALKNDTLYSFYHLSKGTLEQLYLSLRIVALELLYKDMTLPIIIDDGFVHYDYKRYKNTLDVLEKLKRQVIIFNLSKSVF